MKELKLYISDDGKKEGTQEEVLAYEKALSPLAKFKFPWQQSEFGAWHNAEGDSAWSGTKSTSDVIPLLNLMPLVEELRQVWIDVAPSWRDERQGRRTDRAGVNLLLAYEKALGIEQPV